MHLPPRRSYGTAGNCTKQNEASHTKYAFLIPQSLSASTPENIYSYAGDVGDTTQQSVPETYQEATIPSGPSPPPPAFRSLHSIGMSDDMWRSHREIALEILSQMDPTDARHKAVPIPYCNACCLDAPSQSGRRSSSFGYPSTTFRVTSREDGHLYCVRRFDNVKSVSPKIAAVVMEKWAQVDHPGLCTLARCFVAQRAVFFVHQYVPGARSIRDRWSGPLSESVIWSAIVQFVSVIRRVHASNLAIRTMDLAHVLSKTDSSQLRLRVYLNCVGVVDALEFEARKPLVDLQHKDIRDLGHLILSMATGTEITSATDNGKSLFLFSIFASIFSSCTLLQLILNSVFRRTDTLNNCERFCVQNYSRELHNLCFTLIRSPVAPTIMDVSRAMAGRAMDELDSLHISLDTTESALAAEYDSGRALRLLLKLGFVNERPEFGPNRRWAQSGDCYVLTLFRDYGELIVLLFCLITVARLFLTVREVFHQADGAGVPVLDLGHVITALNKLDAADEEKIVLSSRDGKSLMVVSYADVAAMLDSAYHELCAGSVPPSALQY